MKFKELCVSPAKKGGQEKGHRREHGLDYDIKRDTDRASARVSSWS
jgi:hypothetical protein